MFSPIRKFDPTDTGPHWLEYKIFGYWVDSFFLGMSIGLSLAILGGIVALICSN